MNWFLIFVYTIGCFGLCTIIIDAIGPWHIFEKIHNYCDKHLPALGELISCFMCCGTWVGMIASIINLEFMPYLAITPFNIILSSYAPWYIIIFCDGMFTCGAMWLIHTVQLYIEMSANKNIDE